MANKNQVNCMFNLAGFTINVQHINYDKLEEAGF